MEIEKITTEKFRVSSLPVENVQALAAKNFPDVPIRYIRPENQHADEVISDEHLQIPVIDMSKLNACITGDHELSKLHSACKDWGFFQLINHGVCEEIIDKLKNDMAEFFELGIEEKMICGQLPNSIEGYGQAFVQSEEQKLDWGDMLFLLSQPLYVRNMSFWPTTPSSFRATLDQYSSEAEKVSKCLLRMMAKNLKLDSERLVNLFENGMQGIRMNYYPPCVQPNRVTGLTPHSDATGLTLLIQANEVEGLQIKKDGKWLQIKPIPGAFIINIGDIIEVMSNGEYKSIEHRALVNKDKERLSIAAFHGPNFKAMIGPLPELVNNDGKEASYKSITHEEYVGQISSSKLDGKNLLDDMKLDQVN